jgi:hypothetical protein
MLDHNSRSATVRGHVESINILFKFRNFDPPPTYWTTQTCVQRYLLREKKNKCIPWQQNPISCEIHSALLDQAINKTVVFECFTLIRIRGLLCAEYAQKTQTNVEEHEYASGKHVVKAFVPSNWKFYNSKGRLITDQMEVPKKLKMTFQIQKNRQNGQSITLMADDAHLDIFPVWAAYRIYLRAKKWVNRIQSQWAYSSTNLASKIISREVRLPRYYDLLQRESIRTGPPTN